MRAIVYRGVKEVELKEVEKPTVKDDSVIIRVNACASRPHCGPWT